MIVDDWINSANKSWGTRLTVLTGRDVRVDLLRQCEIKGDCWVALSGEALLGHKWRPVQRVAYTVFKGPIPHKREVRIIATCGNPKCCLPDHLVLDETPVKQRVKSSATKELA